jgi:ABC-type metal ion transport system substrate-binding protein
MNRYVKGLLAVALAATALVGCSSSSDDAASSDDAVATETVQIAVPNDATNQGRAIKLLESAGLIEVDPDAGWTPETKDITKYVYDIEIVPQDANTLPQTLEDLGAATINGTYAIPAGLIPSQDGLITENQDDATDGEGNPYVNIIVARSEDKDNETYKTIVDAFHTDIVGQYIIAKFNEAFIPAFDYSDTEYSNEELLDLIDNYESSSDGKEIITVGVCGANNDHWNAVQYVLDQEDAGIYIDLQVYDQYTIPNDALNNGDIDLNSFQHKAYLANEVETQGYDIEAIGDTLMAPLTLYSKKYDSVDAIKAAAGLTE